ncbi:hypothetical protein [Streptomyces sp. NPDC008141]|uniref:hypothetical protein n=1 Tax=Streptomyces sp. NPDC008141 TaxID=3364815 RepID=UPI0036F01856
MSRTAPDPRGWARIDDPAQTPEGQRFPTYPFIIRPTEYVTPRLKEIDRDSAENLLLALTEGGCTLANLQHFTESESELRAMARTIVERYGDAATCRTNVSMTGSAPGTLDFTLNSLEYSPMTHYTEDCGLVVISDTEVGLFWTFNDLRLGRRSRAGPSPPARSGHAVPVHRRSRLAHPSGARGPGPSWRAGCRPGADPSKSARHAWFHTSDRHISTVGGRVGGLRPAYGPDLTDRFRMPSCGDAGGPMDQFAGHGRAQGDGAVWNGWGLHETSCSATYAL